MGTTANFLSLINIWMMALWGVYLIRSHTAVVLRRLLGLHRELPPVKERSTDVKGPPTATCIVTGATSGVGRAAAEQLAQHGFHVILACRSVERGEMVADAIAAKFSEASVEVVELELCSPASIKNFAENVKRSVVGSEPARPLKLLVNNAGRVAEKYATTSNGVESTLGSNYLGHFELTQRLLPLLCHSAPEARVLHLVSFTHRAVGALHVDPLSLKAGGVHLASVAESGVPGAPYVPARNYQASKMCMLLMAYEAHRRFSAEASRASQRISSIHPSRDAAMAVRGCPAGVPPPGAHAASRGTRLRHLAGSPLPFGHLGGLLLWPPSLHPVLLPSFVRHGPRESPLGRLHGVDHFVDMEVLEGRQRPAGKCVCREAEAASDHGRGKLLVLHTQPANQDHESRCNISALRGSQMVQAGNPSEQRRTRCSDIGCGSSFNVHHSE